jgi:hypothetical protein
MGIQQQAIVSYLGKTLEEAESAQLTLSAYGAEIVLPLLLTIEPVLKQQGDLTNFPVNKIGRADFTSRETASISKVLTILTNATELIRKIGHTAEPVLISALENTSICVCSQAAYCLGMAAVRSKSSVPYLVKLAFNANQPTVIRSAAQVSLMNSEYTDQETWNQITRLLKSWADKTFPYWESTAKNKGIPAQKAISTLVEGTIPYLLIAELNKKEVRMRCAKCGTELTANINFCSKCGTRNQGAESSSIKENKLDEKWSTEIGKYLTQTGPYFTEWSGEQQERSRLASFGVQIVMPTVRITLSKMRSLGKSVDNAFIGPIAQKGVQLAFARGADLILEIVNSLPKEKQSAASIAVSKTLIEGLEDNDAALRALTAIYCGLLVVDPNAIKANLLHLSVSDSNTLVKAAATIPLERVESTKTQARSFIENLAKQFNPELAESAKRAAKGGNFSDDEAAFYKGMLIQYLISLIAKQ